MKTIVTLILTLWSLSFNLMGQAEFDEKLGALKCIGLGYPSAVCDLWLEYQSKITRLDQLQLNLERNQCRFKEEEYFVGLGGAYYEIELKCPQTLSDDKILNLYDLVDEYIFHTEEILQTALVIDEPLARRLKNRKEKLIEYRLGLNSMMLSKVRTIVDKIGRTKESLEDKNCFLGELCDPSNLEDQEAIIRIGSICKSHRDELLLFKNASKNLPGFNYDESYNYLSQCMDVAEVIRGLLGVEPKPIEDENNDLGPFKSITCFSKGQKGYCQEIRKQVLEILSVRPHLIDYLKNHDVKTLKIDRKQGQRMRYFADTNRLVIYYYYDDLDVFEIDLINSHEFDLF